MGQTSWWKKDIEKKDSVANWYIPTCHLDDIEVCITHCTKLPFEKRLSGGNFFLRN